MFEKEDARAPGHLKTESSSPDTELVVSLRPLIHTVARLYDLPSTHLQLDLGKPFLCNFFVKIELDAYLISSIIELTHLQVLVRSRRCYSEFQLRWGITSAFFALLCQLYLVPHMPCIVCMCMCSFVD